MANLKKQQAAVTKKLDEAIKKTQKAPTAKASAQFNLQQKTKAPSSAQGNIYSKG